MQIYLELSRRAGRLPHLYEAFNNIAKMREPYRLDPDGEYSYFEICDRWLKNTLGEDKGLDWHLADGLWTDEKTVQQKYPRPFFDARAQVYFEFMVDAKEDLERTVEELGIPWETDDYQPVPDWKPGPAYERTAPYDLFVTNMKVPNHALSHTHKNSILSTLSSRHNDLKSVWINSKTAAARGISHGDRVVIETTGARRQTANARVTQLVHPEVLATPGLRRRLVQGQLGRRGELQRAAEHRRRTHRFRVRGRSTRPSPWTCEGSSPAREDHDDPVGHGDRRGLAASAARRARWRARPRTSRPSTPGTRR